MTDARAEAQAGRRFSLMRYFALTSVVAAISVALGHVHARRAHASHNV